MSAGVVGDAVSSVHCPGCGRVGIHCQVCSKLGNNSVCSIKM